MINIEKLINFIQDLPENEQEFYGFAMNSFYGELTDPAFDPLVDSVSQADVEDLIGEDYFLELYPIALEFFLSNDYPDVTGKTWNAAAVFLERYQRTLSVVEQQYLQSLQSSYMGVYEVAAVNPGNSLTLRDLLQEDTPLIVVQETETSCDLSVGNVLGARLVKMGTVQILSDGLLILERESVNDLLAEIRRIDAAMEQDLICFDETANPRLIMQKQWVNLIAEVWLADAMRPVDSVAELVRSFVFVNEEPVG